MLAYYALQGGGRRRFFGGKNILAELFIDTQKHSESV